MVVDIESYSTNTNPNTRSTFSILFYAFFYRTLYICVCTHNVWRASFVHVLYMPRADVWPRVDIPPPPRIVPKIMGVVSAGSSHWNYFSNHLYIHESPLLVKISYIPVYTSHAECWPFKYWWRVRKLGSALCWEVTERVCMCMCVCVLRHAEAVFSMFVVGTKFIVIRSPTDSYSPVLCVGYVDCEFL